MRVYILDWDRNREREIEMKITLLHKGVRQQLQAYTLTFDFLYICKWKLQSEWTWSNIIHKSRPFIYQFFPSLCMCVCVCESTQYPWRAHVECNLQFGLNYLFSVYITKFINIFLSLIIPILEIRFPH